MNINREHLALSLERAVLVASDEFFEERKFTGAHNGEGCRCWGVRYEPSSQSFNFKFAEDAYNLSMHCVFSEMEDDTQQVLHYGLSSQQVSGIIDDIESLTLKDTVLGRKRSASYKLQPA